jgi:hypothetical protein
MNNSLTLSHFVDSWLGVLVDAALQATLLIVIALGVSRLLRRRAATVRHAWRRKQGRK